MLRISLMFLVAVLAANAASISTTTVLAAPQKKKDKPRPRLEEQRTLGESEARNVAYLANKVRKELVTLPYYGVFDWLEGEVKPDGTVILRGQVVRPTTKSGAESRVKDIEGVTQVVDEIEVLPLSNFDDQIRWAVYRTLFNFNSPLFRYSQGVVPSIHIIVNNGRVTLKGLVGNSGDANLAYMRANSVPNVFEVKNELQVERARK